MPAPTARQTYAKLNLLLIAAQARKGNYVYICSSKELARNTFDLLIRLVKALDLTMDVMVYSQYIMIKDSRIMIKAITDEADDYRGLELSGFEFDSYQDDMKAVKNLSSFLIPQVR